MINFHPTRDQLIAYAQGTLTGAEALMVAAHCDMCPNCARKAREFTEAFAEEAFEESDAVLMSPVFSSMLASITEQPQKERIVAEPLPSYIELDGRQFQLPRSLRRYGHSTGNWSKLVGKLWQAPIDIGCGGKANLIYMERGGSVPEHTHRGSEQTLVINGGFSDGLSDYHPGDYFTLNGKQTHSPVSDDDEGCLVFTVVDEPLHFTSGIARLVNPFSHLFF